MKNLFESRAGTCSFLALIAVVAIAAGVVGYSMLSAQDHPEHPKKKTPGDGDKVSLDDMCKAIENYIKKDTKLKGGYFCIFDEKSDGALALSFDKVHKEKLANVGDAIYFACADFNTKDGKHKHDLDFFMKYDSKTKTFDVTDISIHKDDGDPRYNWKEETGVWKKVGK